MSKVLSKATQILYSTTASCFEGIRIIQGPTVLFILFPAKKQRDGSDRQLAYLANAETRMMFQRVILAEYERIVGKEDQSQSVDQLLNGSGCLSSSKPMA